MKRRRLLITGVLLLLGGAIVHVAVAWAMAATVEKHDWTFYTPYSTHDELAAHRFGWPATSIVNDLAPAVGVPRRFAFDIAGVQLPCLPIFPGFAINTIFYAVILWVVFVVPGIVRRSIRRRRGLCPACAYPIGTSPVCTECGESLPTLMQRS